MLTKIDWISFSFPANFHDGMTFRETAEYMCLCLEEEIGETYNFFQIMYGDIEAKGRKPYSLTMHPPHPGMTIFFSTTLKHATMEISGQGCDYLADHEMLQPLLKACQHRCTRLDIASDILCRTDPIDFAARRDQGRFKSAGQQISESGTTVYIGSRTSERYCKVYRYNEPHERAKLLRIEYTFKGQTAKLTANDVLTNGAEAVSGAMGKAYGWQHPSYQPSVHPTIELSVYRPERSKGKTIFWLADTVAPLLIRMHKEGQIDIHQWIDDNVVSKLAVDDLE